MKLTFLLVLISTMLVSAGAYSQNTRLSLDYKNISIRQLLQLIEEQTEYRFAYSKSRLNPDERITIDVKDENIDQIVKAILNKDQLTYKIIDRYVIISDNSSIGENGAQQQKPVSGTITDASGVTLPGVSVIIKGTTIGTITDANGKYTLANVPANSTLRFSFVGMKTEDVEVGNKTTINLSLTEDAIGIEEVVAIGYGTVRKSDLTGAVSSLSSNEIKKQPVTSISQAIQGKAPGVVVSSNSGAPGGGMKIRIRGANSILGSNDPLYIVDGVALNIGINDLNVNDIESFEVLKDASSTAVYGSRGANGVILVTTKRGKGEQTRAQFTFNSGFSSLPQKYDLLDAGAFAQLTKVYKPGYFTDAEIADYQKNGGVDWQDEVFRIGKTNDFQLNLSGGSTNTKFYISGNYIDQTGIVTGTKVSKYSVRSNVSTGLGKNLKFDLNLYASRSKGVNTDDNGSKGAPLWNTPLFPPTFKIYAENGQWNRSDNLSGPGLLNPLMVLKERYSDNLSNSIAANAKATYKFTSDLKLEVVLGADNNSTQKGAINNKWTNTATPSASLKEEKSFSWQNSNILTYHKKIKSIHDLTVVAVNEQSRFTYNGFVASGTGVDPISVGYDNLGIANGKNISSYKTENSLLSYLGRVSYSLMDRYLLTVSYRADGTSKFQGNNKWGYFPAAAIAWRVSEESFMKTQDFISNLKLRGSWGKTGNQGIDAYATIAKIGSMMNTYGLTPVPGSIVVGADNPDLKWETTEQKNVGVDISVLNGKVSLSADYYVKNTSDLLHGALIPAYDGGGTVNKNIGEMENKGFEISLSATPISNKNFKWDASFNISAYKNKLLSLGIDTFLLGKVYAAGMTQESPFAIKVGESLGSFWGYEWQGVYKTDEAAEAAKYGFKPGDNKYLDYNHDGEISSKDKHIIGSALPKLVWGFDNTFTYKNLELNIMLQAVVGKKILNTVYAASTTILSDATAISHVDGLDYWTTSNENARFANPLSSNGQNLIESTQYLQDGGYVKVKNVALAYNLSKKALKFVDLKLTVSAQNLFTFTKYKGYDPESSTSSDDMDGAIDVGAYPNARTITFGLQANF